MKYTREQIFFKVKDIIISVVGELEEVSLESDLEEDLGVSLLGDLPKVINKINAYFETELYLKQVLSNVHTVGELVDLVFEETQLL